MLHNISEAVSTAMMIEEKDMKECLATFQDLPCQVIALRTFIRWAATQPITC